jgi:FkbM family methyltransferase
MSSSTNEPLASEAGHRTLLQIRVFGPEGLSIQLDTAASDAGPDTYVALYSRSNDIVLYLGIGWANGEVTFSKCIAGEWLDKMTRYVSLNPARTRVCITIRPGTITVEIDGHRTLDWPLEIFYAEVATVQASGIWVLESAESSDADLAMPESVLPDLPAEIDLSDSHQDDLIFDFGMHNGDDTDYYLKKGFRTVSVDANPTLCAIAATRFQKSIEEDKLRICNLGVAPTRGELAFYVNKGISEWSSFDRDIASRGHPVAEVKVRTVRPEDFFKAFGVPYYCKIDIEGFDRLVVDAISRLPVKPRYVSFENGVLRDFEVLVAAGYTAFQLVEQSIVPQVKLPQPSAEGNSITHDFPSGASGPFGKDLDGGWLTVPEMRERLEKHHKDLAARPERGYDWWDLHARHQDA